MKSEPHASGNASTGACDLVKKVVQKTAVAMRVGSTDVLGATDTSFKETSRLECLWIKRRPTTVRPSRARTFPVGKRFRPESRMQVVRMPKSTIPDRSKPHPDEQTDNGIEICIVTTTLAPTKESSVGMCPYYLWKKGIAIMVLKMMEFENCFFPRRGL